MRDTLTLVRIRSGHDFANYKRATLLRRVSRRMQVCETETIAGYHASDADRYREVRGKLTEQARQRLDYHAEDGSTVAPFRS